ncbi:MAG: hypothetical protein U0174_02005 [Polyangiaceae bacterium]
MVYALISIHVIFNLIWVGSICGVGFLLQKKAPALARDLYKSVANPGFFGSFAAGVALVSLDTAAYMRAHWFHGKLTAVVAVIALHHIIGARAKRESLASESVSMQTGGRGAMLVGAFLLCAALAVVFVIFKQALVR